MKNLLTKKECGAKAFYNELNLGFKKSAKSELRYILRDLISTHGLNAFADINDLMETLIFKLDDSLFSTVFEKEEMVEETVMQLNDLYTSVIAEGFQPISGQYGVRLPVAVGNTVVNVTIDFFLQKDNIVYPVVFNFGSPNYTLQISTKKYYGDDERFYLIYEATKDRFTPKQVIPTLLYQKPRLKSSKNAELNRLFCLDLANLKSQYNLLKNRLDEDAKIEVSPKNISTDETKCLYCNYKNLCKIEKSDNTGVEIVQDVKKASGKVRFTKAQEQVIAHRTGEMRVLAGAGSGKTTCLVNRIVAMIAEGKAKPKDFLLITFTEKGCREMKEKLEYWLSQKCPDVEGSFVVETFNSFGQKVVQRNYKSLGFTNEPYLIDDITGYDILTELSNNGYRVPRISYSQPYTRMFRAKGGIAALYDAIKIYKDEINSGATYNSPNEMRSIRGLGKDFAEDNCAVNAFVNLVDKYNDTLKSEGLIDYSDQIYMCLELLGDPLVRAKYSFKHIIVDEMQDTSLIQMKILQHLYKQGKNSSLLVCGDDAQAIFGFRGVGPENIMSFKEYYPEAEDVYMVDNFRSTHQICRLANKVIALNENQISKSLVAHRGGEEPVIVDTYNFTDKIAKIVQNRLSNGVELKDICILAATRMECFAIRKELAIQGIPTIVSVSERYIDDAGIVGAHGLANFFTDQTYVKGLLEYKVAQDVNYRYSVTKEALSHEADLLVLELAGADTDEDLYRVYLGLLDKIPETMALKELKTHITEKYTKFSEIKTYIDKIFLYQSDKTTEADTNNYNAISISTIHASKGREFKEVIVSTEKLNAVVEGKEIAKDVIESVYEEERIRLLYVAITRAMEKLYIVQYNGSYSGVLNELVPCWTEHDFHRTFSVKIQKPKKNS